MNNLLSKKGYDLIVYYETGNETYYNKKLKTPTVPGWENGKSSGDSGVTLMVGIDCGYVSKEELEKMIWDYVTAKDFNLLVSSIGLIREKARDYLPKVKHIEFEWEKALQVFNDFTIPKFRNLAIGVFPGFEDLHIDCQSALISTVFNRGGKISGESRKEIYNITKLTAKKDYRAIANEIIKSKRLWIGKNLDGLLARRDAEADLVESCIGKG